MSLNKAILYGKEKRQQYRKSKRFDRTCRNHGSCNYCRSNRTHKYKKKLVSTLEQLKEYYAS